MTPSAINIKGGSSSTISISIDDNVGIKITSPKKLTLGADSEIIMKTPKNVKINGVSQINALKSNTQSGFSLETDLHFLFNNVISDGKSSESYPDFDDEPQAGEMPKKKPPKEEKKGFNWGKLALIAIATVAVVASVATFGLATTVGVMAIGAIAASAAVGAYNGAKGSIESQKAANKDVDCLDAIKAGFVGMVTGAKDMIITEACVAADWVAQNVLGTLCLTSKLSEHLPLGCVYQYTAEKTTKDLEGFSVKTHEFFKNIAPYKDAYEAGEYILNIATIANGVNSIGNISKNIPNKVSIGQLSLEGMNVKVPVLCVDGSAAICSSKDIIAIAAGMGSSGGIYNMASGSGNSSKPKAESNAKPKKHNVVDKGNEGAGNTVKAFDIVKYGDKTPGLENHHGVLDVWAKNNISGYVSRARDSTTIALTKEQHAATKAVYRDWLFEKTGRRVGGKVDWTKVSPQEAQRLSEKMFDAAGVPDAARKEYYKQFNQYIYK